MELRGDGNMNPELKKQVQGVRGIIKDVAEQSELPERFDATPSVDCPAVFITDKVTGRETRVPLFAYGQVRRVLTELFG